MKNGYYARFLSIFKISWIARIATEIICCLIMMKCFVTKISRKKVDITLSNKKALEIINRACPKTEKQISYSNPRVNHDIDLSIVVPEYNNELFVKNNLECLINQETRYTYEIIVVDDESTDNTMSILQEYCENPKVKVYSQKHQTVSTNNVGIDHASGKYIMFVDDDDIVKPDIVENLLNEAYQNDLDMVIAAYEIQYEETNKIVPHVYPNNLYNYKYNDVVMNYPGFFWGKIYKREVWNNVRSFSIPYSGGDSIIQFLIYPQCKKYKYYPQVEYTYRKHKTNDTNINYTGNNIQCINRYWLLLDMLKKYEELSLPFDESFYTTLLRHLSVYMYNTMTGFDENIKKAIFVLCKEQFEKYRVNKKVKMPYMLRQIEKAFINSDFELWKLASLNY